MPTVEIEWARPFLPLIQEQARYKVFYGGRGGAKSWAFARALLVMGLQRKLRVLCCREFQNSIADSVHKLLSDQIGELGFTGRYDVTQKAITGVNGTEFIFKGLRHNATEIKSLEGVDVAWVEEAQSVSRESWDLLIPTIRKEGSEIWISFNPGRPDDETYQRFVVQPPDDAIVVKVGWRENPWFPDTLRKEMEYCRRVSPDDYQHIWEGEPRILTEAQVFKGRYAIEEFTTPDNMRFFHGADWGFACLKGDTMITTDYGDVPIKEIKIGDRVLTRDGFKKVLHAQSRGIRNVYDVDFGYKKHIIATGDHRIFTYCGWKKVEDLQENEQICVIKSSLMGKFIRDIQKENTQTISIGSMVESTSMKACTGLYGNTTMGKFQKAVIYTMLTATHSITALKILCALQKANIKKSITRHPSVLFQKKKCKHIGHCMDILKKIGQNAGKSLYRPRKRGMAYVKNAGSHLRLPTYIRNFVALNAGNIQIRRTAKKNILVNGAGKSSWQRLMESQEKLVRKSVPIKLSLLPEKEEVFDITVENGEYFANGVLVHNCDPTALVRCFIQGERLYIDQEAYGVGVELDETPALFDSIPTARKWAIKADNARPETISFMRKRGFNISPAKKWAGSVEDGLAVLKSFEKIIIHPRCKHTIEEFNMYSYKVDKNNGDILPIIVDAWNHCIDALRYSLDGYIHGQKPMKFAPSVQRRLFLDRMRGR